MSWKPSHQAQMKRIHKSNGCYGCRFADELMLGRGACCMHSQRPLLDTVTLRCTRREPEEEENKNGS